MEQPKTKTKFSYSRLSVFDHCGWRYKLNYEDKHYVYDANLANLLGSTLHYVEEHIAIALINGEKPDYDKLKDQFMNINIPKTHPTDVNGDIYGINILKEKYRKEFYEMDEHGVSYFTKCKQYLETGIYRLENYLKENPNISIVAVEQPFGVNYNGYFLGGYIDRILYDHDKEEYIIEDIKTRDHPFAEKDLVTPLQFVVYSIAVKEMKSLKDYPVRCNYDLPFCEMRQQAGTLGFVKRGLKKLDKIFEGISNKEFAPKPSPLCYWCPYSHTNPNQHEEGKNLCCYYSLWKPNGTAKSWEVMNKWEGFDKHDIVMQRFLTEQQGPGKHKNDPIKFDFDF